jgi:hypothetical protein
MLSLYYTYGEFLLLNLITKYIPDYIQHLQIYIRKAINYT